MIVIYDCVIYGCNDSGMYNYTTILANLALARSVNYDYKYNRKVHCKLNITLKIIKHL